MNFDSREYSSEEHFKACLERDALFQKTWEEPSLEDGMADSKDLDVVVLTPSYESSKRSVWEMFSDKEGKFDKPTAILAETSFPDLLVRFKFFKSRGDALKNGWPRQIPDGFSQYTIGKFKRLLSIYKPFYASS